jgi:hypothetical protein
MNKIVYLRSRNVMEKIFMACALVLFGCGSKNQAANDTTSADAIKTPARVEQAAKVLDLTTFPLMDGAEAKEAKETKEAAELAERNKVPKVDEGVAAP